MSKKRKPIGKEHYCRGCFKHTHHTKCPLCGKPTIEKGAQASLEEMADWALRKRKELLE